MAMNGAYCSEKDLDTELGDAEGTLMRCGQSLLVGGHLGGLYTQSLHCDRPTPDLILQDGPHQDTRSCSAFQRTLPGASPGSDCSTANRARSSLPYPIKQENSMGYKISDTGVHSSSQAGFQNCSGGQVLGMTRDELVGAPHVNTSASGVCTVGSAVSENAVQPFNNEDGSSPLALSPSASRHSARLLSASSLRRRCLSLASQSSAAAAASVASSSSPSTPEEINITAIICSSSQMSMVACVNGFRSNLSPSSAGFSSSSSSSSSTSPPSNSCSREAPLRPPPHGSPQQHMLQESCQLSSPATCLLSLSSSSSSSSSSVSSVEPEQGQSQGPCEERGSMLQGRGAGGAAGGGGGGGGSDGLGLLMNGALMSGMLHSGPEAATLLDGGQRSGAVLKQEPLDDFSPSEDELFQHHYHHHHHLSGRSGQLRQPHHPSRPAMPPPYHLHQYQGPGPGGLLHHQSQQTAPPSSLGLKPTSGGPPGSHTEREEVGGGALVDKQVCRWIDCSAAYEQQEELVRHIEKVHIDQRKGEDFTCFWASCIRRYKPFNARYKLLIHMRVHSGEKPNKCMDLKRLKNGL
ncbi:hypothetical protein NQZ68_014898 [Dissostichus eleginoides]|nr:hypothetical protein NQZ68_014898 [Dissostichus eleginoides]